MNRAVPARRDEGAVFSDETGPLPYGRGSDKLFYTRSKGVADANRRLPTVGERAVTCQSRNGVLCCWGATSPDVRRDVPAPGTGEQVAVGTGLRKRSLKTGRTLAVGLILATLATSLARGAEPAIAQSPAPLQLVRIAPEHVDRAPQDHLDPCSFDPNGAVLFLTEVQISALEVPYERLGSLVDHVRRFRPNKTMATVGVGSIARLLGEPVAFGSAGGLARGVVHLEYDRYHTPQEGIDFFSNLATAFPSIAQLLSVGQSVEGRDLWALKITDNPDTVEPQEEKIFFCALHHAREWATHEMVLYLAEHLVTRYDTDLRVRNIVDNSVVWILLAANPDGFQYSWETNRFWRKNRRNNGNGTFGVDLNRNYDYNWGPGYGGSSGTSGSSTYRGPSAASEPETQAIQALLAAQKPAIAITYHTYSQLVLYPWGYTGHTNPEAYTSLRGIGDRYASLVEDVHGFTYTPGVGNYTIYAVNGDFTDYAYGAHGILAYTPELRPASSGLGGFVLPEEQILPNNEENLAAALWMMDNVADARFVDGPASGFFSNGFNPFSLPLTPVNQAPEAALAMDETTAEHVSAWLDDGNHGPPAYGTYPADFEGVGAGSGYRFDYTLESSAWADAFTGYTAMPYVFEEGAVVMLENVSAGFNYIGIPSPWPVRMSDISIFKRTLVRTGNTWGKAELVLETRTALEDLHHSAPWISWMWTHTSADGTVEVSHPEGPDGMDEFVHPYRSYEVLTYVPSYAFWSDNPTLPVYLLQFPPSPRGDADHDGDIDLDDHATLTGCMTGPVQQTLDPTCTALDVDHDFDVDMTDAAVFQRQFGQGQ